MRSIRPGTIIQALALAISLQTSAVKADAPDWPKLEPGQGYVVVALSYVDDTMNSYRLVRFERMDEKQFLLEGAYTRLSYLGTSIYVGTMPAGRYRFDSLYNPGAAFAAGGLFGTWLAYANIREPPGFEVVAGEVTDLGYFAMLPPPPGKLTPAGVIPMGRVEALRAWLENARPDVAALPRANSAVNATRPEAKRLELARSGIRKGPVVAWGEGRIALLGALGTVHVREPDGAWNVLPLPTPLNLRALAVTAQGELMVGGEFGQVHASADGTNWRDLSLPAGVLAVRMLWASAAGDLVAVAGEELGTPSFLQQNAATDPATELGWLPRKMTLFHRAPGAASWTRLTSFEGWGFQARGGAFGDSFWVKVEDGRFIVVRPGGSWSELTLGSENVVPAGDGALVGWDQYQSTHDAFAISRDGGATWMPVGEGDKRKGFITKVSPAYLVDGVLHAIGRTRLKAGSQVYTFALFHSADGGANWAKVASLRDACAKPSWMGVVAKKLALLCSDGQLFEPEPSTASGPAPSGSAR